MEVECEYSQPQACLRFLGFKVMLCKFPILCAGRGGHNHEMSRRLRDPLRNMNKCKDCQLQNISEQQQEGCPSFIINLALYLTYLFFVCVISVLAIYAHSGRPSSHAARFWIGHCITRIPPHNFMYTIVGVLAKILPGARFSQAAGPWMQTAEAPKETKDWSLMG